MPHKGAVTHRFLAYSSPSRLPDPDHLAVLARPGFVRAAPALPVITRLRLPSAPPPCCDRPTAKVSHLHSNLSASRRTHDVRHSYATAGRDAKIDWKALSQRIGHADVAFTMKQYVQTDLEADRQVANTLAALILGGALTSAEVTKDADDATPGQAGRADGGQPGEAA